MKQALFITILFMLNLGVSAQFATAPPGTYEALSEKDSYEIPFKFFDINLMIDAQMNGIDIKMLIDNGVMWDELMLYGSVLVDSLNLQLKEDVEIIGAGEGDGLNSKRATNLTFRIGDIIFMNQNALVTSKESGFADFFPGISGQVCGALFKHFIVEFDFDRNIITLHKPEKFVYRDSGIKVPMTRNGIGSYSIPVRLKLANQVEIEHNIFIDLGGIDPISLPISKKYGFTKPDSERIYIGHGASGEINGYAGQIESLSIGRYSLTEVPSTFVEAENDGDHTNTTIGLPLLMKFNLIFNYHDNILYMKPNKQYNLPYKNKLDIY